MQIQLKPLILLGRGGGGQYYIGQGDDLDNFVDEEPHKVDNVRAVSYTHLTLPTKLSV